MSVEITVKSGTCQGGHHKPGERFVVDWKTPAGFCLGAWDAVAPYVTACCVVAIFRGRVNRDMLKYTVRTRLE